MQSTGHTSTHDRSLMPMQGSAITYVMGSSSVGSSPANAAQCSARRSPSWIGGPLGEELLHPGPELRSDAIVQLAAQPAEHGSDGLGVEPGDPGFLDHRGEVDT